MKAGIYARVSVCHGNRKDQTIENQILLAEQYLEKEETNLLEKSYYIDRGYTGRNFSRPAFQRMMRDAEQGKLDCIIVKDLSRLGRDYLETGWYLEQVFPELGIRVIALGDCYDSHEAGQDSLAAGIKNIMNEWYARETGEKVRRIKNEHREAGEYLGSRAPYGYEIVYRNGKRILQKDDSYCILEKIWKLRTEGLSSQEIAQWLNDRRIYRPGEYRRTKELICPPDQKYLFWDSAGVRRLWKQSEHQRGLPLG